VQGPAYGLEPYAMAGDIYSQPPHVGRGGWSWYTGAAAWLHRAAVESMFGLQQGAQSLSLRPCLPSHWDEAELSLRRGELTLRFILVRSGAATALAAASHALGGVQARLLWPGEALDWAHLTRSASFVVPLLELPAPMQSEAPAAATEPV